MAGAKAFELMALADGAITTLADLGLRYRALHDHASFPVVKAEMLGRAQRALDRLGEYVATTGERPLCGNRWSAADITVYTTADWLAGLPGRAATFPPAKSLVELGWSLPAPLRTFAEVHRHREDVRSLG
jgi:hypothetical protein